MLWIEVVMDGWIAFDGKLLLELIVGGGMPTEQFQLWLQFL